MIKSKYNWNLNNPTEYISDSIAQRLKLSPIIKKILESKNIIEVLGFMRYNESTLAARLLFSTRGG